METSASICNTNKEKQRIGKTAAQRQKEYRRRKKIEKELLCPKKLPKTNAENQQKFREKQKKILQECETLNLARKKANAERSKRYRDRLKSKKLRTELYSLLSPKEDSLSSKGDSISTVLIKNEKEIDHSHNLNCKETIVSKHQMQKKQIKLINNETQKVKTSYKSTQASTRKEHGIFGQNIDLIVQRLMSSDKHLK